MNKAFLTMLGVFLFYFCYSFAIRSNTAAGIFNDLFIQIKPFLAFFCVYAMMPALDARRKAMLKSVSLLFWSILLVVGLTSLVYPDIMKLIMGHPAYYAAAVTITALCFFYCSRFTPLDKIKFLLLLSIVLLSGRSKAYGFFALSTFVILFFSNKMQFRWNARNVLIILTMLAVITLVAWDKIHLYFYQAITEEVERDMIARYVLYSTAPEILHDYFPFGSGLATYATYASGLHYSHIYGDYGIDEVWGITKTYYSFIADTYYPSLAQFGVAGIGCFLLFWGYVCKRALGYYRKTNNLHLLILTGLIVGYLAIESTTDSTLISNRGVFVMMLLGLILAGMKQQYLKSNLQTQPDAVDENIANQ
jgi:hypothetical protein